MTAAARLGTPLEPPEEANAMIEEGKQAPAFTLQTDEGRKVSLADFKGKYLIVYFYPKDDTPGCTIEAREFSAARNKLDKLGAAVLGVSRDSIESHCKFRDKHGLEVMLASDPDTKVIEKYGAWGEKNMYGKKSMGIIRSTVVVGPDGKVKKLFRKVKVDGHVAKVLDVIAALRKGGD
ncbi:MAG: thioredoxin-dependent thiol peroxidase [Polyangiales bacterium]